MLIRYSETNNTFFMLSRGEQTLNKGKKNRFAVFVQEHYHFGQRIPFLVSWYLLGIVLPTRLLFDLEGGNNTA